METVFAFSRKIAVILPNLPGKVESAFPQLFRERERERHILFGHSPALLGSSLKLQHNFNPENPKCMSLCFHFLPCLAPIFGWLGGFHLYTLLIFIFFNTSIQ